jgi:membrane fusion protein (multidrug efflux system)
MNWIKFFLGGTILIALSISCNNQSGRPVQQGDARTYPVLTLQRQYIEAQSVFPATLRGEEDAEIKPRVSGYIDRVFIDEGAVVKKGQALFTINSPASEQDLAAAKAALETADANLNTARLDVERIRPLAEKNIVSKVQLQTAINALRTAEAQGHEAEIALKAAQATTAWTTVTSPIDGVVGSIPFRVGNMVTSATTLTTVAKTGTVYAYFSLNEKALLALLNSLEGETQAEKIKNMPEITLLLADGSIYPEKGKISSISGTVNSQTGSVSLRASFPNRNGLLRSGASGRVSIPKPLNDVFVIPQKATFTQQDKVVIYKVVKTVGGDKDSTVQTIISVQPLPDGKRYAVTDGLNEGERIVLDGVATLGNARIIKTEE